MNRELTIRVSDLCYGGLAGDQGNQACIMGHAIEQMIGIPIETLRRLGVGTPCDVLDEMGDDRERIKALMQEAGFIDAYYDCNASWVSEAMAINDNTYLPNEERISRLGHLLKANGISVCFVKE